MSFQIEKKFVVKAAPPAVWAFLTDPRRVAGALPGAAITEQVDERTYAGTLTVKVGPVMASYKGKLSFARLDPVGHSAEIVASGQEVRGKGGADMRLTSRLWQRAPGETEVSASSEVNVTGILAQMGRGMIQDVGDQIFQKFSDAMRAELESPPSPTSGGAPAATQPPLDVVSLGAGAAARAAGRSLRRPGFWIALGILILIAGWLLLRR